MILQRLSDKLTSVLRLGFALALGLTLTSCGNNGCEKIRESYLEASFKATGRVSLSSVYAWALTAEGDSLMTTATSPTEMEFILKPDTSVTQIRLASTITEDDEQYQYNDTLTLVYEYYPYFLDMECGCSVFFEIKEATITNAVFKSIEIKNKEITNDETVNLVLTY